MSSNNWIDDSAMPNTLNLHYKAKSNTEVKVFKHTDDSVTCDLSDLGKQSCSFDFKINAKSVNGTVALQTEGTFTISSECLFIKTSHAVQASFWELSSTNNASLDPAIDVGYEIRDPSASFTLPFVKPTLASSSDPLEIFNRCGPMTYTVTISSTKSQPYDSAFTITLEPNTKFESAIVAVETDDQSYALSEGEGNGSYKTKYDF